MARPSPALVVVERVFPDPEAVAPSLTVTTCDSNTGCTSTSSSITWN